MNNKFDKQIAEHMNQDKPKALSGLLVVDFTRVLSGPTCSMMLVDHGARVIKIERPKTGDDTRANGPFYENGKSVYFSFPNRGKESIALDLKNPEDIKLVKKMIAKADIVVENFRPGTMAKLGLAPDELLKLNPRLIVCSISGYGQYGDLHQNPAYDTVIQALSGIMDATGTPEGSATRVGTSIADLAAGVYGYAAITTALYAREKTGRGTTVDIAMLDCLIALMEHGMMDSLGVHIKPHRMGNSHPFMYPFDTFQCQDGLVAICVGNDKLFNDMCQAIGIKECVQDPRFISNQLRSTNQKELKKIMEVAMINKKVSDWVNILEVAGVPVSAIYNVDDTRKLNHVSQRGMVIKLADGTKVPGSPLKFGTWNSVCALTPAPELDANGEKIKKEFM